MLSCYAVNCCLSTLLLICACHLTAGAVRADVTGHLMPGEAWASFHGNRSSMPEHGDRSRGTRPRRISHSFFSFVDLSLIFRTAMFFFCHLFGYLLDTLIAYFLLHRILFQDLLALAALLALVFFGATISLSLGEAKQTIS